MSQRFSGMLALCAAACSTLGCSDPVPASAGAGLLIDVGQCPTTMPRATLGNPNPDSRRPGDPVGTPIYSGQSGTQVSCRVSGDGTIVGNVKAPGITFDVSGTVNPTDGRGTGTVGLFAGGITEYVSQTPESTCELNVVRLTSGFQIEPGAVYASFRCSNLRPGGVGPTCIASGEFVLTRCRE